MIARIVDEVYCIKGQAFGSNVYLLKDKKILIDTSSRANREQLIADLNKVGLSVEQIKIVLLTHAHSDHIANAELFVKAKIYADVNEIRWLDKALEHGHSFLFASRDEIKRARERLYHLPLKSIKGIKIIRTPGHTAGSVCFLYTRNKKNILFSGDTLFDKNFMIIGRTDLPESRPELMQDSLEKIKKIKFDLLCPGH
ncbi:MAG: MBL fold metallo-hydrolase [Candidatus Pacearchaeota archaeon]